MSVRVMLTPEQADWAAALGQQRTEASMRLGLTAKHGAPDTGSPEALALDLDGAIGEVAVAVYLGLPLPTSVNTPTVHEGEFRRPDLMSGPYALQVRAVRAVTHCLIYRPGDDPWALWVLATTDRADRSAPTVDGWLPGLECRLKGISRNPSYRDPAWFVPRTELRPMPELRRVLNGCPICHRVGCLAPHQNEMRWELR